MSDESKLTEQLSAYLDGELSDTERAEVERRLESDPRARALLDELRQVAGQVGSLPRAGAPRGLQDAVLAHLERDALLGKSSNGGQRSIDFRPWLIAAVLVFAATASLFWRTTMTSLHAGKPMVVVDAEKSPTKTETPKRQDETQFLKGLGYVDARRQSTAAKSRDMADGKRDDLARSGPTRGREAGKVVANAPAAAKFHRIAATPAGNVMAGSPSIENITLNLQDAAKESPLKARLAALAASGNEKDDRPAGKNFHPNLGEPRAEELPFSIEKAIAESTLVYSVNREDVSMLQGAVARVAKEFGAQVHVGMAGTPESTTSAPTNSVLWFDVKGSPVPPFVLRAAAASQPAAHAAPAQSARPLPLSQRVLVKVSITTGSAASQPTSQGAAIGR